MKGKPCIGILCVFLAILPAGNAVSQARDGQTRLSPQARLQYGVSLYGRGFWPEAAAELRQAYSETNDPVIKADALYWIAITELASANYDNSIRAMDELERVSPANIKYAELPYHRGRVYYYMGRFDEAISLFRRYIDSIAVDVPGESARKPAAFYWMGECLYSLGQLDKAQDIFSLIVEQYPQSVKYEASSYRLALINQKKIEVELLSILKWTHEESLKTEEEYQRRERTYDQAIIAYQKKIAEMLRDSYLAELEASNADYRQRLAEAQARITALERRLEEAGMARSASRYTNTSPSSPADLGSYRENTGSYVDNTARNAGTPPAPPPPAPVPPSPPAAPAGPPPASSQAERIENIRQSSVDLIDQLTQALNNR
ncbi:MAG: tetratricopeptide repeat protein [Treponema sp.]|nr:tetratricopeptide repeat protein [Treponema sp.]